MKSTLCALALLAVPSASSAAKITISDEAWINVGGYMQAWAYLPIDTDEGGVSPDFYMRRAYMTMSAQATKATSVGIAFYAGDVGKAGDATKIAVSISDAYFEYKHSDAFFLTAGLYRAPTSRQELTGTSGIHGLDFHSAFTKQPTPVSMRDVGLQVRGFLVDKHLEYRFAVFDGSEPNPLNALPRLMARAAWHAFEADTGLTVKGAYLGKMKVLDIGAGFDLEPAGGTVAEETAWAAEADVFADVPLGDNGITATAEWQIHAPTAPSSRAWAPGATSATASRGWSRWSRPSGTRRPTATQAAAWPCRAV